MTAALRDACADLAAWLPAGAALIGEQDADGTSAHGKPGSRPPWNAAAANAVYDAHAGLRRLERQLRYEVTGQPWRGRGGSDANTMAAIKAIADLASSISHLSAQDATYAVSGFGGGIKRLRAVDEDEGFIKVSGVACYHCGNTMLRLGERSARVACLRYGACFDCDGLHPTGFVSAGPAGAMVAWADGCNQYAQVTP